MFHQLVSRNDDLKRLVDKGYAVAFDSEHLVVRDIPYLNDKGALCMGAIVTVLTMVDDVRAVQKDHQVYFAGGHPHGLDGKPIPNLAGGPIQVQLSSDDIKIERQFSNKPPNGFPDFFAKIESYVTIIAGPAMERYGVSALTFRMVESVTNESPFKIQDTLTSRAAIGDLAALFRDEFVAVIGLGGTGNFILDFLVKTPVKRIVGFDGDDFHVHNAFRSPGRLIRSELGKKKADVYDGRYQDFRTGLTLVPRYFDIDSEIDGATFAFVSVDKGSDRRAIFDALIAKRIPFIDVGMGLARRNGPLAGMLRVTYVAAGDPLDIRNKGLADLGEAPDNIYQDNIQIIELNALNASLAVLRYKQIKGFYVEESSLHHMLLGFADLHLIGESDD